MAIVVAVTVVGYVRNPQPWTLATIVEPPVGLGVAVLAVLRHRFSHHLRALSAAALVLAFGGAVVSVVVPVPVTLPGLLELLGLALLTGACCHRLPARSAGTITALAGVCLVLAPLVAYRLTVAAIAVSSLAGVFWVSGIVVGLILRDADTRHEAALAFARSTERLALARELHDLVAHHITGVVVRAQAASLEAADSSEVTAAPQREMLAEIETAGRNALDAMRRLVGMLREPGAAALAEPYASLHDAVLAAVGGAADVRVDIAADVRAVAVRPEVVSTAHRVVLEALTNVRKHASNARQVSVSVGVVEGRIRLCVTDDGSAQARLPRRAGYGLVGMRERVTALGGELAVGRLDRGWQVAVLLPIGVQEGGRGDSSGGSGR